MPSNNFLTGTAEGLTKGLVSWGEEKIKELVKKFQDRRLVFVNNKETIDLIKEQLKSGDWSLCKQYLRDPQLKILVQMGLTLRKLESNQEQLLALRDKIQKKFGTKGLHIAQVIQNNILTEFIGAIASKVHSGSEIIEKVENLLNDVDKLFIFIKTEDDVAKKVQEINVKLQANNPSFMLLFSIKTSVPTCEKIKNTLEEELTSYSIETKTDAERLLVFLFKKSEEMFNSS